MPDQHYIDGIDVWNVDSSTRPRSGSAFVLLYFERLPECLLELPFVRPSSVASFPHVLERGIRPPGGFEDFFNDRYEEFVWNSHRDDFVVAGYERYDSGLADGSMAAKWLQA